MQAFHGFCLLENLNGLMVETLKFQNNLCVYGPDGRNCVLRNIHICGKTRSSLKGRGLQHPLSVGEMTKKMTIFHLEVEESEKENYNRMLDVP